MELAYIHSNCKIIGGVYILFHPGVESGPSQTCLHCRVFAIKLNEKERERKLKYGVGGGEGEGSSKEEGTSGDGILEENSKTNWEDEKGKERDQHGKKSEPHRKSYNWDVSYRIAQLFLLNKH